MLSKHSILHLTAAAFNHPWAMAGYEMCHVAGLMASAETQRLCLTTGMNRQTGREDASFSQVIVSSPSCD